MNSMSEATVEAAPSLFARDGYLLLEGHFTPERIDRAAAAMRRLLAERPNEVVADHLRTSRRVFWGQADRRQVRDFEFNDLYLLSEELRELALDTGLASAVEGALGESPVLFASSNFYRGAVRHLHIDSLYLTPRTPHGLAGAWIAFEDVHPDSGPFYFYPGSHHIPLYRFNDGSHHATREEESDWFDYIDVQLRLRGLKQRRLLARKGDVFLWHADLVHGEAATKDPNRTRTAMVCHYFGESDCRERELTLVPLRGRAWLRRQQLPVRAAPDAFGPEFPFPEESYLRRHPDVRDGVASRVFPSGEFHYRHFGFVEGRGV